MLETSMKTDIARPSAASISGFGGLTKYANNLEHILNIRKADYLFKSRCIGESNWNKMNCKQVATEEEHGSGI